MLRRFFSYYAPYKKLFFLDFGCAILAGLLELGFPMAIKTFIAADLCHQHLINGDCELLGACAGRRD